MHYMFFNFNKSDYYYLIIRFIKIIYLVFVFTRYNQCNVRCNLGPEGKDSNDLDPKVKVPTQSLNIKVRLNSLTNFSKKLHHRVITKD